MSGDQVTPQIVTFPHWKRSERNTLDSQPILWRREEETGATTNHNKRQEKELLLPCCTVCDKHISRYKCPRCKIPYCSVDCYRKHTTATSTSTSTTSRDNQNGDGVSSVCTEAFYRNRVQSILRLEKLENIENTQRILSRQYEESIDNLNEDDAEEEMIANELYGILQKLDEAPGSVSAINMSPALKAMFQKDLENGSLQNLILKQWHPWWTQELVTNSNNNDHQSDDNDEHNLQVDASNSSTSTLKTLDERLLQVPNFASIQKKTIPILLYNLIEILYATCWTLRLYHGVNNACKLAVLDASATLISASFVLGKDARYDNLQEVLGHCTTSSTQQYPSSCNVHWDVLVNDCALLLTSHRMVGRALLEALDIIKLAIKHLKTSSNVAATGENEKNRIIEQDRQNVNELRRIRKKLEYFLSWSQDSSSILLYTGEDGGEVRHGILEWIETWKTSLDANESESVLDNLIIPNK